MTWCRNHMATMSQSGNDFPYPPLNHPQAIRLLELMPGKREPLVCRLKSVQDVDEIKYEALSYACQQEIGWDWNVYKKYPQFVDKPKQTAWIRCNERWFTMSANLGLALYRLRGEHSSPRVLWIDAICLYSYRTAIKHLKKLRYLILSRSGKSNVFH